MLSNCEVVGADWAQGLKVGPEEQSRDTASPTHPCLALGPLPIKLDLSQALWSIPQFSILLASIWVHSAWGLVWDEGCGMAGQRGGHKVGVFIPHLRGCGWLHPVLKGHSSYHPFGQLFPHALLLSWVPAACFLYLFRPGGRKQPQGAALPLWFPNPAHYHVQKLCSLSRDSSQSIRT